MLPALLRSKLLVGYLALGVLAAGLISVADAAAVLASDVLLAGYAFVIWRATRGEPTLAVSEPAERPRPVRDLLAVAFTYLLVVGFTFWFWFGGGLAMDQAIAALLSTHHVDPTLAGRIGNAAPTSIELAVLLQLVLTDFRLSPAAVCLPPRHLVLGVGLAAFSLGLGVLWTWSPTAVPCPA